MGGGNCLNGAPCYKPHERSILYSWNGCGACSRFALPAPNSIDNHAPMQDTSDSIGLHFPEFAISAFKPADRNDSSIQFPSQLSFLSFDVFHPS